jgi:hypothetical protein
VLIAVMRSSAGTMRSSVQERCGSLIQVRSITTRVRSIAQVHRAWSEGCARTQLRNIRAQACNCAVNGATTLDRRRCEIERTYRV